MSRAVAQRKWGLGLAVLACLLLNFAAAIAYRRAGVPVIPPLQLRVAGERQALAGGTAGFAVTVRSPGGQTGPVGDCPLEVRIGGGEPLRTRTDGAGTAPLMVPVPQTPGPAELLVVAGHDAQRTELRQPLEIVTRHRVLLLHSQSDVQPGATIHWLARVTDAGTGRPVAGQPVTMSWCRQNDEYPPDAEPDDATFGPWLDQAVVRTDPAGIAAGRFTLSSATELGALFCGAISGDPPMGGAEARLQVVDPHRWRAEIATSRTWYRADEPLEAVVTVRDAEGWPADGLPVTLTTVRNNPSLTSRTRDGEARFRMPPADDPVRGELRARIGPPGPEQTFEHRTPTIRANTSPYRAVLQTVDGPAEWGIENLHVLQLKIADEPASASCRLMVGEREVWSGTTDARGFAQFRATWAEGDQPVARVGGFILSRVLDDLRGPARSVRLRVDPVAYSGSAIGVELLAPSPGPVAIELHADSFLRSVTVVDLGAKAVGLALPTPEGLTGEVTVVARPLGAGPLSSRAVLLLPPDGDPPSAAGTRLLVGAAPTPAAREPLGWPLALGAAGIDEPLYPPLREALRQIARSGRINPQVLPAMACWLPAQSWRETGLGFETDAAERAVQATGAQADAFLRWYRPAIVAQGFVVLALLVLWLAGRQRRSARLLACLLPLCGAVLVALAPPPIVWSAAAGFAALALVGCRPDSWMSGVLAVTATGVGVWGLGLEEGTAALLAAAAVGLAGMVPLLPVIASARPSRAGLGIVLLVAGSYGVAALSEPVPGPADAAIPSRAATESLTLSDGQAVVGAGWRAPELWTVDQGEPDGDGPSDGMDRWRLSFDAGGGVTTDFDRAARALHATIDWPEELLVGDEIELPLRLLSADGQPHKVTVRVELDSTHLDLLSPATSSVGVAETAVAAVAVRVRAVKPGPGRLTITVTPGDGARPQVLSSVIDVLADGLPVEALKADRLLAEVRLPVEVPEMASPGTPRLELALYGSARSWCEAALEQFAAQPIDGLRQAAAELLAQAVWLAPAGDAQASAALADRERANLAYQRLLLFRQPDGGFADESASEGASPLLDSAWALLALGRYGRAAPVDPLLMNRLREGLLAAQGADGLWPAGSGVAPLMVTALATWALAGLSDPPTDALARATAALTRSLAQDASPIGLAWMANALLSAEAGSTGARQAVLRLVGTAAPPGGDSRWHAPERTPLGSTGGAAQAETCAAAVLALMQAGSQPELAASGLDELLAMRRPAGDWGSAPATALAVVAAQRAAALGDGTLAGAAQVAVNAAEPRLVAVEAEAPSPTVLELSADLQHGRNTVALGLRDGSHPVYGLRLHYAIAWPSPDPSAPLSVEGSLDQTTGHPGDVFTARWSVKAADSAPREGLALTITPPAGWRIYRSDLESLQRAGWLRQSVVRGDRVTLYLAAKPAGSGPTLWRLPTRFVTAGPFIGRGPRATVSAPGDSGLVATTATERVRIVPPDTPSTTVLR